MPIPFWLRQGVSALDEYLVSKQAGRERGMQEALNAFDAALRFSQAQESQVRAEATRQQIGLRATQAPLDQRAAESLIEQREAQTEQTQQQTDIAAGQEARRSATEAALADFLPEFSQQLGVSETLTVAQYSALKQSFGDQATMLQNREQIATLLSRQEAGLPELETEAQKAEVGAKIAEAGFRELSVEDKRNLLKLQREQFPDLPQQQLALKAQETQNQLLAAGARFDSTGKLVEISGQVVGIDDAAIPPQLASLVQSYNAEINRQLADELGRLSREELAAAQLESRELENAKDRALQEKLLKMREDFQRQKIKDAEPQIKAQAAARLRQEFMKHEDVSKFIVTRANHDRVLVSQEDTRAANFALIYSFYKVLEPTSAVLEGEFRTAGSELERKLPGVIKRLRSQIVGDGKLTREAVEDVVAKSTDLFNKRLVRMRVIEKDFVREAEIARIDPSRVTISSVTGDIREILSPEEFFPALSPESIQQARTQFPGKTNRELIDIIESTLGPPPE